jgi:endonuclease/exonuclease/phosphatase family metal-dependent hydrolase
MKVISWNIFNGQAANPTLPAPELAESIRATIASVGADILAVQEVDENQERSGNVHQMEIIANAMGAEHWGYARAVIGTPGYSWRHPNSDEKIIHSESKEPGYGIGLASKIPVRAWHRIDLAASWIGIFLPFPAKKGFRLRYAKDEPRVAIVAELENGFTITATHLSFVPFWNYIQLAVVKRRLRKIPGNHIIIGDLNIPFTFPTHFTVWRSLVVRKTFPSYKPTIQFDYILAHKLHHRGNNSQQLVASEISLPLSPMSDHRPIGAEISLE